MQPEGYAVSCEEACNSTGEASTGKDKDSTQGKMACMKNGVLTRFFDSTKYSGAPDVGLPFGCPTMKYQVHAKAQDRLLQAHEGPKKHNVCPKESLGRYKHTKSCKPNRHRHLET